jgi:hypothetical protein
MERCTSNDWLHRMYNSKNGVDDGQRIAKPRAARLRRGARVRAATVCIQSCARKRGARKICRRRRHSVVVIQARARGFLTRKATGTLGTRGTLQRWALRKAPPQTPPPPASYPVPTAKRRSPTRSAPPRFTRPLSRTPPLGDAMHAYVSPIFPGGTTGKKGGIQPWALRRTPVPSKPPSLRPHSAAPLGRTFQLQRSHLVVDRLLPAGVESSPGLMVAPSPVYHRAASREVSHAQSSKPSRIRMAQISHGFLPVAPLAPQPVCSSAAMVDLKLLAQRVQRPSAPGASGEPEVFGSGQYRLLQLYGLPRSPYCFPARS